MNVAKVPLRINSVWCRIPFLKFAFACYWICSL